MSWAGHVAYIGCWREMLYDFDGEIRSRGRPRCV